MDETHYGKWEKERLEKGKRRNTKRQTPNLKLFSEPTFFTNKHLIGWERL